MSGQKHQVSSKIAYERISRIGWACMWPGLARLWYRGDFSAWAFAVGFSLLLNLALLSTFLWTRWPGDGFFWIIWPIVIGVWTGSAVITYFQFERMVQTKNDAINSEDTLLNQAQTEYLKENWSEVQSLISLRLKREPRDVVARLLMASAYRRAGDSSKAEQQLEILGRFDESEPWRFEIDRERALLHQALTEEHDLGGLDLPQSVDDNLASDNTNRDEFFHRESDGDHDGQSTLKAA